MFLYSLYFDEKDINNPPNFSKDPVERYFYFPYDENHSTYPLNSKFTSRVLKNNDNISVVTFLSVHGDQKTILYWLIDHNKDKSQQIWPTAQTFFANPYNIISLYYKEENDYIIVLFIDENPPGTFNLKAYTKKYVFNDITIPTSYTFEDGNTNINTKLIIDTFSTSKQINGYTTVGNIEGYFQVALDNEIYTYHWDFNVGAQNRQLRYYIQDVGSPISYYMDLASLDKTPDSSSDKYFLLVSFAHYDFGMIKLKKTGFLFF